MKSEYCSAVSDSLFKAGGRGLLYLSGTKQCLWYPPTPQLLIKIIKETYRGTNTGTALGAKYDR